VNNSNRCRELRRERILFNREKAIKVAQKQKELQARFKELEKQEQEKLKAEKGCPIKRAEKMFYEHIARSLKKKIVSKIGFQFLLQNKLFFHKDFPGSERRGVKKALR